MKIYLAGGMSYGWQDRVDWSGHEILDPRSWQCDDPAEYTRLDLEAISSADVVVAYMCSANPSGYGLSVELGYAAAKNKLIIFVDNIEADWRSRYFGMHRSMATVVKSLEEALALI